LGLLLGAASAQEPEPTTDTIFSDQVEVEVVEVEVFVSDRQGRAVTDLAAEDFEIYEDGRPVEITNFHRAVSGEGNSRPAAEPAPSAAPRLPSVQFQAPPPEDPLYLVLYVDNANLRAGNRRRVLRDLRELVQGHGGAAERIMVVSHERSLQVRQGFTSSRRSVIEALLALEDEQVF
ncbi:MAG: VWA domain-containing protein, partial [Ketobacter sp.]|nr:VWA domain-containing protein [Ketobacter sp.]